MEKKEFTRLAREEAWRRFEASKKRKREHVEQIAEEMKAEYKKLTGLEATNFEVW